MTAAVGDTAYTVQHGDTLAKLAVRCKVPIDDLMARNALTTPDVLVVGQTLSLPDGVAPRAAAPAARPLTGRELLQQRARLRATQRVARGQQLVSTARRFLGTPYRRGGLSSRGLDCSGLVVRAMAAQGRNVPHHAATLYRMGERVRYEQLQSGDLLFFNTNGRGVSHVGIWIGNNRFIHASSGRGGVRQDAVAGYYARRLVGARRLH